MAIITKNIKNVKSLHIKSAKNAGKNTGKAKIIKNTARLAVEKKPNTIIQANF